MAIMNKLGKVLVLDLLNTDNGTNFTFDDIVLHEPVPSVVPEGIRNTTLLVTPAAGSRLRNQQTVSYWRIDLDRIVPAAERIIPAVGITSTEQIVSLINNKYGLAIDNSDVLFESIDTSVLPMQYTIVANQYSYAFIGELEVTLDNGLIPLLQTLTKVNVPNLLTRGNTYAGAGSFYAVDGFVSIGGETIEADNLYKLTNSELEMSVGVIRGTQTQAGTAAIPMVNQIVEVPLAANQKWDLGIIFGITDPELRFGKGVLITDFYSLRVTVSWGEDYSVTFDLIDDAGTLFWQNNPFLVSWSPTLHQIPGTIGRSLIIDMKELTDKAFMGKNPSTQYSPLGVYEVSVEMKPKYTKQVQPLSANFIVSATTA